MSPFPKLARLSSKARRPRDEFELRNAEIGVCFLVFPILQGNNGPWTVVETGACGAGLRFSVRFSGLLLLFKT